MNNLQSPLGAELAYSSSNFIILQVINRSNYSVQLVTSKLTKKKYAVKIFPFKNGQRNKRFLFESRFDWLDHPNVIKFVSQKNEETSFDGTKQKISYIMMELAPYGNFAELISSGKLYQDEILVRTYFSQLLNGLSYLHSQQVFHADLKPQNLLLGKRFDLKITDFDHALLEGDMFITSQGTTSYRAPEIISETSKNPAASDIYSLGIIFFCLKFGRMPYLEGAKVQSHDLFELLKQKNEVFWKLHKLERIPDEIKELFLGMVEVDPEKRLTLNQLREHSWMKGKIYNSEKLIDVMKINEFIREKYGNK